MQANLPKMNIGTLFAIFAALAVLFAPLTVAEASAAVPRHEQLMNQMGHCQMPASGSADHDKMAGKNCCVSMSMAVAMGAATPLLTEGTQRVPSLFPIPPFHIGFLGEIATPPPRYS